MDPNTVQWLSEKSNYLAHGHGELLAPRIAQVTVNFCYIYT